MSRAGRELRAHQVVARESLSTVCADDLAAHVYRHRVAHHLRPYWLTRATALASCGEAGARLRCACCGAVRVAPFRCGARSCPTCAHIASAVAVDRLSSRSTLANVDDVLNRIYEGPGWPREKRWWMFTGTQQTPGAYGSAERYEYAPLAAAIQRVRRAWAPFWESVPWGQRVYDRSPRSGRLEMRARRDVMCAMGVEVAPGGMTHLHAAVYGEAVPGRVLRVQWEQAIGRAGFITCKPIRMDSPDDMKAALREVLKYVAKGEGGERGAAHAALIERAMRRVRRVEMGGALRRARATATVRELVTHRLACEECHHAGSWQWGGLRSAGYIVANGGFGVDAVAALTREGNYWRDVGLEAERARSVFTPEGNQWLRDTTDLVEFHEDDPFTSEVSHGEARITSADDAG